MRRLDLLAWLVLVLLARPLCAQQALVVGVENTVYFPAYGVLDGEYAGQARALLDRFAQERWIRLQFRPLTVPRLFDAYLGTGSVALKFPDDPAWHAARRTGIVLDYSDPVLPYTDGLWVRAEALPAAPPRSIAVPVGFTPVAYLEEVAAGRVRVDTVLDTAVALRLVLRGRVDGAYFSEAHGRWLQQHEPRFASLRFARELPHVDGWYRLSARDDPGVIADFNDFLARARAAGHAPALAPDPP